MYTIDLSGEWTIQNTDKKFMFPGSACENAIGTPQEEFSELTRDAVRCLRPKYDYVGMITLEREFELPQECENKHITLFLERVNIASELWIDGEQVDRKQIEITTPHIYTLTGLKSGVHTLTLRIDNSNLLNIDGMASGYSIDTQSLWLGVIGKIEIRCEEIFRISNLQIFPDEKSVKVRLTAHSDCRSPHQRRSVKIRLSAVSPDGEKMEEKAFDAVLFNSSQILHLEYPISGNIQYWDEFNPVLYTMNAEIEFENTIADISAQFGMRTICVRNKEFIINNHPFALRGTLDCAIYPLTGYPPTDIETWYNTMRTVKEYGLNHVRFHAWCPPEAAFQAADEIGIYISVEMPLWLNHDVCALETGDDSIHKPYYLREALNISNTFGNHPSFIMFSNGNELMGDFAMLEEITSMIRSYDTRRLYTLTSNFDHPVAPCEDYLCAFEAAGHRVRIQVFHDVVSEHTRLSYDEAVAASPVPIVSFEVGQYCVYPDVDSIKDYTGNLLPVNFSIIKRDMEKKNVYRKLERYIKASGMTAVLLYKEDIEASERTHKMGGFQLLGISDYTGQCTATIGLLDVFWKSKGLISPEQFRHFCCDTVPLMKADRVFSSNQLFSADLDLYSYGQKKIDFVHYKLTLMHENEIVKEISTTESTVSFPLDFITKPSMLRAELSCAGHTNSWNIFVYPPTKSEPAITILDGINGLDEYIKNGGNVIVNASAQNLAKPIQGLYKPVFWSPAYFVSDRACGAWCNHTHPIFDDFPTDDFADFQWKHPIDNSVSTDISSLPEDFDVLVEPIPNFFNNIPRSPLFEMKIGKANVLFNGFDLTIDNKSVQALRHSIYNYVSSDKFVPVHEISIDTFKKLFK